MVARLTVKPRYDSGDRNSFTADALSDTTYESDAADMPVAMNSKVAG
jgi:hypothetical protein